MTRIFGRWTTRYAQLLFLACAWAWSGCGDGSGAGTADTTARRKDDATGACPIVQTARGPVMGDGSNDACSYRGIPFAAPPTGELRWKAPQPAAAWTTPRPSAAASSCPQTSSSLGEASTNEDCLYLNVWVPAGPAESTRPIMVFVHGGGFTIGAGTVPLYDGTKLANATGAIVVTINYRLGAFGFLSSAALRAEDGAHPSSGNYGIEDQIAAFQWVKDNAEAFGGDPSNVTIFGESAGGTSMLVHLASPKSAGMFARVIVESAWALPGTTSFTTAIADKNGARLAEELACTQSSDGASLLSCMRGKSVADILQAVANTGSPMSGGLAWAPVVDGFVLQDDPVKVIAEGSFHKVPTLIGNNRNEATIFFYLQGTGLDLTAPEDAASYEALEESFFPGNGAAIVAEYPISSFEGSYKAAAAEAMGDAAFVCGARRVAHALAASGVPTFRYDFNHALDLGMPGLGAFHASELPFVFGNPLEPRVPLAARDLPVVDQVMAYWGSMAKHGNPSHAGGLAWPRYDTTNETQLVLGATASTASAFKKEKCSFWDGLR
jgi:para-nitrobenzyl esterase